MKNREGGHILVIILGIILVLFLVGFFRTSRSVWSPVTYKKVLRLPCGLTVSHPGLTKGEKISFPLKLDGYVNDCGWTKVGMSAGTAQVFDGQGRAVTDPTDLVVPSDSIEAPYYFSAMMYVVAPPSTDTGTIIIKSTSGLIYPVALLF
jgi:hypothetical protein